MINITEQHRPSFVLFPVNNNRTAWRPFGLPIILIEPHRRQINGSPLANSDVFNVRIAIENVPRVARVVGHNHMGLLYPDSELYTHNISTQDLLTRLIDPAIQTFEQIDGTQIDYSDATDGDVMVYTTATGITERIIYKPTANYYDLSDISLETEQLPADHYFLSYQADYCARITTNTAVNQLVCIDPSNTATAVYRFEINHPGEVLQQTVAISPAFWYTESSKAESKTIDFLRPLLDVLQDAYDEQRFLKSINWVDQIIPEFVPYLAYLIGADIPFFPRSVDKLRKTILTNIVRLQQLKGSKRALVELFELFGYTANVINLYWEKNGTRLIRPGQSLPDNLADQEIQIANGIQIDPIVANYKTDGYGELTIPLLAKPVGNITVDAYLIEEDTDSHSDLDDIVNDINNDPSGYGDTVSGELPAIGDMVGYTKLEVNIRNGTCGVIGTYGYSPVGSARYDQKHNAIYIVFNGKLLFSRPNRIDNTSGPNTCLYAFATYNKQYHVVPDDLIDLQSNRFDFEIIPRNDDEIPTDTFDFLIDYLLRLKAFHSLLNVILYTFTTGDTYLVTDLQLGGDIEQRYDTDAGRLQLPPAKIPIISNPCNTSPSEIGYTQEDIAYRDTILNDLNKEFELWKRIDERNSSIVSPVDVIEPKEDCPYNYNGQDRTIDDDSSTSNIEILPGPASNSFVISNDPLEDRTGGYTVYGSNRSNTLCDLNGFDFKFRGRARDEIAILPAVTLFESHISRPCRLGLGTGVYYFINSLCDLPSENSLLGRLRVRVDSTSLCYSNRRYLGNPNCDQIALEYPSLDIVLPYMHFPGTRFPTMGNLETDFTHLYWPARPWDDFPCSLGDNPLNLEMVENTAGDLVPQFDSALFSIPANGIVADIPSLGDHAIGTSHTFNADDVVHAIYTTAEDRPDIELEGLVIAGTDDAQVDSAIFKSANNCNSEIVDYIDGYPAVVGYYAITGDFDLDRGLYTDFINALGLESSTGYDILFLLSSGIRVGQGYRLDCGCLLYPCTTSDNEIDCGISFHTDEDYFDPSMDAIETIPVMQLIEDLDMKEMLLDGSISSLLEIL